MTAQGARVLYIDDDEGLRRLVVKALERRGYSVVAAADGLEGVRLASESPFDLIAVDHYMPTQDGLTTIKQLQQLPNPPSIVYVTGSEESRTAVAALKAGAIDYVVKTVGEDFFDLLANTFISALRQVRLRQANEEAERALRASNERLKALLGEVNHRVANSLQLVSSLVRLQAGSVSDPAAQAALLDTQRRIQAVAQVHRRLYTSEALETVDLADYLGALVGELRETYSADKRRLILDAEPIHVSTDQAVSLGVIVNELITNACKYAYLPDREGDVRVSLVRDGDDKALLVVEDDGCGLPEGFGGADFAPTGTGLGTKVMAAMATSLRSALEFDPDHAGVRARLAFMT